ncbi:MAG: MATE family efflux transporter [Treponema sp.]|jgi:putative MATE family efflux protein|nr:MATE family efflux transporter [Treponema sp.]
MIPTSVKNQHSKETIVQAFCFIVKKLAALNGKKQRRRMEGITQKNDQTERIGTGNIGRLLIEFSVPAIIGMFVNAIYNIVDRIYVGQGVDPLGIAGITVAMPLMMVLMASSMLVGIGANSLFSIRLGEGRREEVEKIMGHALLLLILIPSTVIIVSLIFFDDIILHILGASPAVFPYCKDYLEIILYGGIFSAIGPGLNHFIRSDGHPRTSMVTQLIGAGINIVLDPIFIFGFNLGIAGAAWATVISQFISFVWVMAYFNSKYTKLRFSLKNMRPKLPLIGNILVIGLAPFTMQIAMSFVSVLQNHALDSYGGDTAVSAMGISYSIMVVFFMPLMGLNQGAQPIIGYNYGAKQYGRVKKTFKIAVLSATVFMTFCFIVIQLFPRVFIGLFHSEEGPLMDMGVYCVRVTTLLFPVLGFQVFASSYFQAIGKALQGTILGISRQLLLYIPLLMFLPPVFGLEGVFFAAPIADFFAVVLTALFMLKELKRLNLLIRTHGQTETG